MNGKLSVPKCVYFCNDGTNEYLLTTTMAGEMSCSDSNLKKPEQTIKLLAHAIKQLQSVEILECPFRSDLNYKLGLVEYNVKNKLLTDSPSKKTKAIMCIHMQGQCCEQYQETNHLQKSLFLMFSSSLFDFFVLQISCASLRAI